MTIKLVPRTLPVDEINVDSAYQRLVIPRQVKWIVNHYNEVSFGRILVGQRKNGSLWAVDGQQRLAAAKARGMRTVPCLVFESEGRRHEAGIFKQVNSDRVGVRPLDIFRACLESQEQEAVAINAIAEECGYTIGKVHSGKRGNNTIEAVVALRSIYKLGGSDLLNQVLSFTKETWPDEPQAIKSVVLGGLSVFMTSFDDQYDHARLVRKLKRISPLDLMRYAEDAAKIMSGSSRNYVFSQAIVSCYNKGLRANRLGNQLAEPAEEAPSPTIWND